MDIAAHFHEKKIRVSFFVSADKRMVEFSKRAGADRVELYTEPYAAAYMQSREFAIKEFLEAASYAKEIGLGLNAGHDLSLDNLKYFKDNIPNLSEVSIGHALICEALYLGLENVIQLYLNKLAD